MLFQITRETRRWEDVGLIWSGHRGIISNYLALFPTTTIVTLIVPSSNHHHRNEPDENSLTRIFANRCPRNQDVLRLRFINFPTLNSPRDNNIV